ncbi:uncharacterized protein LY89DRAFT_675250 [Mollisia scopiformis]|uniref:Uncharacterized protein n=1 Tax=Mollisia scopiformis TaxID=149040 RepID=A0A132BDA6_MOLSC|nr:uncharacterized protein LY89DRAFT_675250 [Mollisia scopiformis]KUJ10412.1 hypothetical protein LY89DRAFT_675250 [Mollisia scopiformis]
MCCTSRWCPKLLTRRTFNSGNEVDPNYDVTSTQHPTRTGYAKHIVVGTTVRSLCPKKTGCISLIFSLVTVCYSDKIDGRGNCTGGLVVACLSLEIRFLMDYVESMNGHIGGGGQEEFVSEREVYDGSSFPQLGQKLFELQDYITSQKPRTLKDVWNDHRDPHQAFTSWAVVIVGHCTRTTTSGFVYVAISIHDPACNISWQPSLAALSQMTHQQTTSLNFKQLKVFRNNTLNES